MVAYERDSGDLLSGKLAILMKPKKFLDLLGKSVIGRTAARCHRASMECVLPPPKFVCRLITGAAFASPRRRSTAPPISSRSPSVR